MAIENLDTLLVGKLLDWGILGFGVKYLAKISGSVSQLNKSIAVLFERTDGHEKTLEKHDERITHVERHVPIRRK